MSDFIRLCGKADLPAEGQVTEINAGSTMLCIANVKGEYSALNNTCPHRQGPLGQGWIEDGHVICPWHAWAFNVRTGLSAHTPREGVEVYPLKVVGDDVLVQIK